MPTATQATPEAKEIVDSAGIRFTVASRPQRRFSNAQTVNNLASATSFQPIQLPATGFVRKIAIFVTLAATTSAAGAGTADGPWNSLSAITLTDATGQPVIQPVSGYSLYLLNKYLPSGDVNTNIPRAYNNPHLGGPDYTQTISATNYNATFRLDLELEQDYNTGYGCVPNLDSNASLQLKIDVPQTVAYYTGGTQASSTVSIRVGQYYWAPVGQQLNGQAVDTDPVGFGDYIETRFETQTVTAAAENLVQITNRGGLVKGFIIVSRAATVRTAFTAASPFGLILDNNPIDEGILLEEHKDYMRRIYGYFGADIGAGAAAYAPLGVGVQAGIETGVLAHYFGAYSGGRDSWLATRVGSLLQLRVTPGASATTLEIITQLGQIRRPEAFYAKSALD